MIRILNCLLLSLLLSVTPTGLLQAASLNETLQAAAGGQREFLPVAQAFQADVTLLDGKLQVRLNIAPGYYLYRSKFKVLAEGAQLGEPDLPAGVEKFDEYFGQQQVWLRFAEVQVPVLTGATDFDLDIKLQGCAEAGLCYPPDSRRFRIRQGSAEALPDEASVNDTASPTAVAARSGTAATTAVDSSGNPLQDALQHRQLWLAALLALLGGLALTFTPCVLPMVPIVVAMTGGQTPPRRAVWLTFLYVQANALVYALLGLMVASMGAAFTGLLQSVWLIGPGAALFVLLALSMFGAYELQLPERLRDRLGAASVHQQGGTAFGALAMGAISGLIVSPCISAPLASVLVWIAQSGDQALGALVLYALACGMGIPLLLVAGFGAGVLPRAGVWMNAVKELFGFGLLAVAIVLLNRLLPASWSLGLWGLLLAGLSIWLGRLPLQSAWVYLAGALRIAVLVYAVALMTGALTGAHNPQDPLAKIGRAEAASPHSSFQRIKTVTELEAALASARTEGKTVLLDFWADWCVACYEFAEKTFPAPAVKTALANTVLLQADVSANDAEDRALLGRYQVLGLPTILLFDAQGKELTAARVTGFMDAQAFAAHLDRHLAATR